MICKGNHYVLNQNDNNIYNIDTEGLKIVESNPINTFGNCRLGHTNKKRLEKLHRDELLKLT